ncbi:MAG: cytochrome c, partial [Gemmatimonadota bacterium]
REFLVSSAQSRQAAQTLRELVPQLGGTGAARPLGGANAMQMQGAQAANSRLVTGRDIYRARCAACHGPEGRGNGPAAAAMNPRPTDFAVAAQRNATTDSSVGEVIEHGRRSMPAFGRMLTRVQMDSLIEYVKTLRR